MNINEKQTKSNQDYIAKIEKKIGKIKKSPKVDWRRSGTFPLFPLEDNEEILSNKIHEFIKAISCSGQLQGVDLISATLTYGCTEILLEEKCLSDIEEFKEVYFLSCKMAVDIAEGNVTKDQIERFKKKVCRLHLANSPYIELKKILNIQEIQAVYIQRLRDAVDRYFIDSHIFTESPNENEIEAALGWLLNGYKKGENEFQRRFRKIDDKTIDRLAEVDFPKNLDVMNANKLDSNRLLMLIDGAADSIIKDRNNRKKTAAPRRQLIFELCDIYYKITDRKPGVSFPKSGSYGGKYHYYGPFFRFVMHVFELSGVNRAEDIPTMGRRIAEVCRAYKNQSA